MFSKKNLNFQKSKILLIGAGNIGSRYLQGLLKLKNRSYIYIIDYSQEALNLSKSRILDIDNKTHELNFSLSLPDDVDFFNLAIIATTSNSRAKLIEDINSRYNIKFWILEKILAQSIEELFLISKSIGESDKVWVNTPRRIMPWYKEIKSKIRKKDEPLKIVLEGGDWGLACNAIHFIDLFSWITDSDILKIINSDIKDWVPSKREGYVEAFGKLKILFKDKSSLLLSCSREKSGKKIFIENAYGSWFINEKKGLAIGPNKEIVNVGRIYQSQLITKVVTELFKTGSCNLPSLEESTRQHIKMIEAFLNSWNSINKKNDSFIKIT